jgi:hypothetical protein
MTGQLYLDRNLGRFFLVVFFVVHASRVYTVFERRTLLHTRLKFI